MKISLKLFPKFDEIFMRVHMSRNIAANSNLLTIRVLTFTCKGTFLGSSGTEWIWKWKSLKDVRPCSWSLVCGEHHSSSCVATFGRGRTTSISFNPPSVIHPPHLIPLQVKSMDRDSFTHTQDTLQAALPLTRAPLQEVVLAELRFSSSCNFHILRKNFCL
jgi:hypothetical protein